MSYDFIVDPDDYTKHSIFSKKGRNLLKKYCSLYKNGGTGDDDYTIPVQGDTETRNENRLIAQHAREVRRRDLEQERRNAIMERRAAINNPRGPPAAYIVAQQDLNNRREAQRTARQIVRNPNLRNDLDALERRLLRTSRRNRA